jgi:hypothetical protein
VTHFVRYTDGAVANLRANEILTGGISGAKFRLIAQIIDAGIAGSSDYGTLLLQYVSGTFPTVGETFMGGISAGTVATAQVPMVCDVVGRQPDVALITVEIASIRFTLDGTIPTVSAGLGCGHIMDDGQSYVIRGMENIRRFQAINESADSGAAIAYTMFYR